MEIRHITDPARPVSPRARGTLSGAGGMRPAEWAVPEETPLAVLVNGRSFAVMMGTPADLEDFAVGFALTEGLVDRADRIAALSLSAGQDGVLLNLRIDPALAERAADRARSLPGRSGCGVCGAQTIEAALPAPPRVRGALPDPAAVRSAMAALAGHQPMNAENRSTHAAAFCTPDGAIALAREDIGRHNALDKLCGALARAGRLGESGFVVLSSRISVEMVMKAAVIGAPLLAAISAPSALALRTAARAGMVLAAGKGDDLMIFDTPSLRERAA